MHEVRVAQGRAVLERWIPPNSSPGRTLLAIAFNVVPALGALAALLLIAPASEWSEPVLLAALAGVAAVSYGAEARLKVGSRVFFGAAPSVALVALSVGGPGPALLVWLVPDLIARLVLRSERLVCPGFVANLGSYAIGVLAGAAILELAGPVAGLASAPSLYAAGLAMCALNFCFARMTFAPFYQGYRPAALIRDEFAAVMPAVAGMLVVGVATALLVDPLGVFAIALLAAVILVPQVALERITHAASAARLARADAMRLYTAAISDVLDLPRERRRELACASDLLHMTSDPLDTPDLGWRDADVSYIAFLALHAHERWAGDGLPAGLPAEAIPQGSRILAVASAWSGLTASGTQEMSQSEAMLALAAQAGRAFDPTVVDAASRVVHDEEGFAREPGFAPTLHRLPVPRSVRRGKLPEILPRLVGAAQ